MRWLALQRTAGMLALLAGTGASAAADAPQRAEARPKSAMMIWDTGRPGAESLRPLAKSGDRDWTALPPGKLAGSFKGDAVVSNGRVVAVLRMRDSAIELHSVQQPAT